MYPTYIRWMYRYSSVSPTEQFRTDIVNTTGILGGLHLLLRFILSQFHLKKLHHAIQQSRYFISTAKFLALFSVFYMCMSNVKLYIAVFRLRATINDVHIVHGLGYLANLTQNKIDVTRATANSDDDTKPTRKTFCSTVRYVGRYVYYSAVSQRFKIF